MPVNATFNTKKVSAPTGFDITAVIGHVEFGEGSKDAFVATFELIGEAAKELPFGASRTYRFDPSGREELFVQVAVTSPDDPRS